VLWCALFTKPFGTSFEILRLSTLVMGFLGGAAMYAWLRAVQVRRDHAVIGTLCLILNPIYFALSFTFMTDVPYTAVQTAAIALLLMHLRGGHHGLALAGWALALFALSIRQVGLAIAIGYGAALLWRDGLRARNLVLAVLPALCFVAAQQIYEHWLTVSGRIPVQFGFQSQQISSRLADSTPEILSQAKNSVIYLFMYMGLFLLPVSLLSCKIILPTLNGIYRLVVIAILCIFSIVSFLLICKEFGKMPLFGHVLTKYGVILSDEYGTAPETVLSIITFASSVGGTVGIFVLLIKIRMLLEIRSQGMSTMIIFLFVVSATLFSPLTLIPARFDRHFLPIIPCLIALVLVSTAQRAESRLSEPLHLAAMAVLLCAAFFSLAATKDYLSEMRARLTALEQILRQGIARDNIDAGWVLNGWHLYGRVGARRDSHAILSWYSDPVYRIGGAPEAGYVIVGSVPFSRSLPWGWRTEAPVLIKQRVPGFGTFIGPVSPRSSVGHESGVPRQ
jgi:hypothetical protein